MGGIGTGSSFRNNIAALAAKRLVMRVLHGVNEPDPSVDLWGNTLGLPVLAAPVGSIARNIGSEMSDTEYTRHLLAGCETAKTLAGLGDTPNLGKYADNIAVTAGKAAMAVPFIKPWPLDTVKGRLELAARAGCAVCGMDVDAVGLRLLRSQPTPVRTCSFRELTALVRCAHALGMKYIVKGIMAPDEAVIAADAGADAVLVSNHGGRVLDDTPGTAEALPAIADAVGKKVVVMLDGGIRSGTDVLKALALGARVTLICRPVAIAIHGGGAEGLATYFAHIREDLVQAMRLTGCADVAAITDRVLC
jgi:isopentenyl diphosphate isomerase/L-lactate dehydrogenase-like FMN-dependent dehydrogenase